MGVVNKEFQAVLMAGGNGNRMMPLCDNVRAEKDRYWSLCSICIRLSSNI